MELGKIYVKKEEYDAIVNALGVLEDFKATENMEAIINYELPAKVNLKDILKHLETILDMSEIV